jgi:hypothetical protein
MADPKLGVVAALNFGSQHYLGLASSPTIKETKIEALGVMAFTVRDPRPSWEIQIFRWR